MTADPLLKRYAYAGPWSQWEEQKLSFNGSDRNEGKPSVLPRYFREQETGLWAEFQLSNMRTGDLITSVARLNSHYWFLRKTVLTSIEMKDRYQIRMRIIGADEGKRQSAR